VYGVILGAAMFLGIQIPGLFRYQFRWSPKVDLQHPGVRQVLTVLGPRVLTVFCIQLVFIVQDNLASRLVGFSVSALVYGWLFAQVPESLIGTALGTALLPTISEQAAREDYTAFKVTVNATLRVILAITIPLTVILTIGIHPLIPILGRNAAESSLIIWTARAYMLGLIGYCVQELTARSFYARQDARAPLKTIAMTLSIFMVLAILFAFPLKMGAPGIALANTLAFSIQAAVMVWLLNREFPGLVKMGDTLRRALLIALGSGVLVYAALRLIPLESMALIPSLLVTIGVLGATTLLTLPFIWPEIKLLLKL
jgi:putative peptidoglycan lipid II flippase